MGELGGINAHDFSIASAIHDAIQRRDIVGVQAINDNGKAQVLRGSYCKH